MSSFLLAVLAMLHWINSRLLAVGVVIASTALAIMVLAILLQVFFRYALNNALPWPEEAARFLMLWMTGLAAPAAYRRGGFVAIDMLEYALPRRGAAALSLVLLIISFAVLAVAVKLGWNHVGSGWLFNSSSLKLPLELIGLQAVRIKLAWMYMSIFAGFVLLTVVNIELILRALLRLLGHEDNLAPIPGVPMAEAE